MNIDDLETLRDRVCDIIGDLRSILEPIEKAFYKLDNELDIKRMEKELNDLQEQLDKRKNDFKP